MNSPASALIALVVAVATFYCVQFWQEPQIASVNVQGKRFLVTGCSQGIGREIVNKLAEMGAGQITLVARSESKLTVLRDSIALDPTGNFPKPSIHIIPADLSSEDVCTNVIEGAVQAMGGLDYLILNHITGSEFGLWKDKGSYGFINQMVNVNMLSYIWMTNAALPALEVSAGQIAVVSSVAGHMGVPHFALYAATKHALHGFFNSLRSELTHFHRSNVGVTVCAIGAVATEGSAEMQKRLTKVDWIDPSPVATAIIQAAAVRRRELFYPLSVYPTLVLGFLSPSLADYIMSIAQSQ